MPSAKRLWIAVVMLLVFWSPGAIAMDQSGLQESQGKPSSRSVVPQEHANTPHEPGYPPKPGHYVTSITYGEDLMALSGQGQRIDLR
jgi:hypothetical protein